MLTFLRGTDSAQLAGRNKFSPALGKIMPKLQNPSMSGPSFFQSRDKVQEPAAIPCLT